CTFKGTLDRSSISMDVQMLRSRGCCDSFHGYAHNCCCMLENHPLYLTDFGIEDLFTCECFFSSMNGVAPLVCHTSPFHWLQFVDLHLQQ
ncbi:hypothetical protein FISHEDRAFT_54321, partial [Fistulina hepatica ATCC 64428]